MFRRNPMTASITAHASHAAKAVRAVAYTRPNIIDAFAAAACRSLHISSTEGGKKKKIAFGCVSVKYGIGD